jgi:hypothetical protein
MHYQVWKFALAFARSLFKVALEANGVTFVCVYFYAPLVAPG